MRREHDRLAFRHLGLLVDEHGTARLEVAHDMQVMDDLLAHVHRWPVEVECLLDRLDGALDPGAVAARRCKEDFLDHAAIVASVRTGLRNEEARCFGGSSAAGLS